MINNLDALGTISNMPDYGVIHVTGDIFDFKVNVLVNPVNTIGVMGAGLAKQFKLRYPAMYEDYKLKCASGEFVIGKVYLYRAEAVGILNFPTKIHWKNNSDPKFIEMGMEHFLSVYQSLGIKSIAFPLLGSGLGGIPATQSISILQEYLSKAEDLLSYIVYPIQFRDY